MDFNLNYFLDKNVCLSGIELFNQLGIEIINSTSLSFEASKIFQNNMMEKEPFSNIENLYFLGRIDEDCFTESMFKESLDLDNIISQSKYNGLLVFGVELKNYYPTRGKIAEITRALNRHSKALPVILVARYKNPENIEMLSISAIERTKYIQSWRHGEKVGKVSILRDINIKTPHSGHIRTLLDLKIDLSINSFDKLYEKWRKVFDIQLLNQQFYQEISNWYYWAQCDSSFPGTDDKSLSIIRMITRIIFVWFMKEKGLISADLFDANKIFDMLKDDSEYNSYYKAILQNLFFATLNTEMGKRRFKAESFQGKNPHYQVHNVFRYRKYFKDPQKMFDQYFSKIPFLNGGLFECLDKENPVTKEMERVDFFSDRDTGLFIPDIIFFAEDFDNIDASEFLNNTYGTKGKKYKQRGLITILNSYKFTITENTPLEEEIALDPELLGRVFENLLASINPETQITARKETGSFYTPREIVNYMVNESLFHYLSIKLGDYEFTDQSIEIKGFVRELLSDSVPELEIKDDLRNKIIELIDNVKIFDPACGSGAFLMGLLQKLVDILHKIDPHNLLWKDKQLSKIEQSIQSLNELDLVEIREKSITDLIQRKKEIIQAFDENELDYSRKLFLIENCIFGSDIQLFAVQISKLRFFISLIIEQKTNPDKPNLGIIPLPNLETKIVAADSLIKLKKENHTLFTNPSIEEKKKIIRQMRHKYFSARSREKKAEYNREEEKARKELANLLKVNNDLQPEYAKLISNWNPYDHNSVASFFNSELMFGESDGFDIVIGNPPYIQLQKNSGKLADMYSSQGYKTFERMGDIYSLFYENGVEILKPKGILTFITSNKWMRAGYGKSLREYFIKQNPLLLIDLGPGVFKSATVDTNILIIQKSANHNKLDGVTLSKEAEKSNLSDYIENNKTNLTDLKSDAWFIGSPAEQILKSKIEKLGKPLKDWDVKIFYGIKTGLNEAFIIDNATKERLCLEDPKSIEILKPILRGRDIKRYSYQWAGLWLIFVPWHFPLHKDQSIQGASEKAEMLFMNLYPAIYLHLSQYKEQLEKRNKEETGIRYEWYALQRCAATYYDEFEKEKVVWSDIATEPLFSILPKGWYFNNTVYMIISKENEYILSILNSKVIHWLFPKIASDLGSNGQRYFKIFVEKLPVPLKTTKNALIIKRIKYLVDEILKLSKQCLITAHIEKQIDVLVYKLYELNYDEVKIIDPEFSMSEEEYKNMLINS